MQEPKQKIKPSAWFIATALTVLFAIFIRAFVFETFMIPSHSMSPTVLAGDHVFVNKLAYGSWCGEMPKRGDVVVFDLVLPGGESRYVIKRIIGVSGDVVSVEGRGVFVNGEKIRDIDNTQAFKASWRLGDGDYFVLGDNMRASQDSRVFGPISIESIRGRAYCIYWSWDPLKKWSSIRWQRLGRTL